MDTTLQAVLILMIVVLGATLAVVGIMFAFILRDLRKSIERVNTILNDVQTISSSVASSTQAVEQSVVAIKQGIEGITKHTASPVGSLVGMFTLIKSLWRSSKDNE